LRWYRAGYAAVHKDEIPRYTGLFENAALILDILILSRNPDISNFVHTEIAIS